MERLELLRREVAGRARGRELLLYHRRAEQLRLRVEGRDGPVEVATGAEHGSALTVWGGPGRPAGFAASSGLDADRVHWMLDHAIEGGAPLVERPWAAPAEPLEDVDDPADLPPAAELIAWLEDARRMLGGALGGEAAGPTRSTVDVARTVETWAADGWTARRVRCRAWARAWLAPDPGGVEPPPLTVAARRAGDLPPAGWAERQADRIGGREADREPPVRPLLLAPEPAAGLVLALVRTLHSPPGRIGLPVGPGWRLLDDPGDRSALHGALFDDLGHPALRDPLADGASIGRSLRGARRPSYRDRPVTLPFHIVVEPPRVEPPDEGWLVSEARLHPLGTRWAIDVAGAELRGGSPVRRVRGTLETTPEALAAGCLGGIGPARVSHLGVVTPALVLDPRG